MNFTENVKNQKNLLTFLKKIAIMILNKTVMIPIIVFMKTTQKENKSYEEVYLPYLRLCS